MVAPKFVARHTPWPSLWPSVLGLNYIMSHNTGAHPRFFPFVVNSPKKSFTTKEQQHIHNEKHVLAQSLFEIHPTNLTPVDLICGIGLTPQGRKKDE